MACRDLLESGFVERGRVSGRGWDEVVVVVEPRFGEGVDGCVDGGLYEARGSERQDFGSRRVRGHRGLLRSRDNY
jgi:hypothetical protein